MISKLSVALAALAACFYFLYQHLTKKQSSLPLPPSPPGLPIVGNIKDLPPPDKPAYLHWLPYKDTCGPIARISVLDKTLIIIHDKNAAHDLLEKSSLKTASRPVLAFAGQMCGFDRLLTFRQYDDEFRWQRKLIHQQLGTKAIASQFHPIQEIESRRFLLRALEKPNDLIQHIKTEAAAIILKIIYGYTIEPNGSDPLVELIEHMMEQINHAALPATWMVDVIPALKHLPDWFPGTAFKEVARQYRRTTTAVYDIPFDFVADRLLRCSQDRPSYVSALLEGQSRDAKDKFILPKDLEIAIKGTAGTMYAGGADTTVSTLSSFVLAMVLYPDVQKKAQAEIDRVVGTDRLPNFEDRSHLPYIDAIIKEATRWLPVLPMCVGHETSEDVTYNGFRIPKGAFLLPAVWWFLHDPETYPDPETFDPERYIEPRNEPDPAIHAFGYGRRVCPGRYMAADNLYITVSRLLATFDIGKAVDEKGNELEAKLEAVPGVLTHPKDFPYSIKPRSQKHADMVRTVEKEHPWEKGDGSALDLDTIHALMKE